MSLLIQQEDDSEEGFPINGYQEKMGRMFGRSGVFDSDHWIERTANKLAIYCLFDIDSKYRMRLEIGVREDGIVFGSTLMKGNQLFVLRDMASRLVYWRLVNKFFTRHHQTIVLTALGQFKTKKVLKIPSQIRSFVSFSKRRSIEQMVNGGLLEFVEGSVLFYKCLIPKLERDLVHGFGHRQGYLRREGFVAGLCNASFFPTLDVCRRSLMEGNCEKEFGRLFVNYPSGGDLTNNNQIKRQCLLYNNQDYGQFFQKPIDRQSFHTTIPPLKIDIKRMYDMILEHQQMQRINKMKMQVDPGSELSMYFKTFVTNLDISWSRKQSQDRVCNVINVLNHESIAWEQFESTGLSELKIAKVRYSVVQNQKNGRMKDQRMLYRDGQVYNGLMILKHQPLKRQQKSGYQGQLKWQRAILQECFPNQACIYLARFYIPKQHLLSNNEQSCCLLSQYMRRGTLHKWLQENGSSASIFTKVNLILYILYGVAFVHSKKVLHMDLKPANILIDRNLVTKLTDFGSAYNKQVYEKMRKQKVQYFFSFSIPYTAPEIFMKSHRPQINAKCDVFSLGIIMYEILFNGSLFGSSSEKIEKAYKRLGRMMDKMEDMRQKGDIQGYQLGFTKVDDVLLQKVFLCPQNMQEIRCPIYEMLLNLVMRCLSCNQQRRPYLGFLVIAIKQIYQMFLEYHSW